MVFRGKEDIPTETIQTHFSENWYLDLKEVPSIALPGKALVGASMSLCWRMNREDKPVYMENDKGEFWGFFALEGGKMGTVPKRLMMSFGIFKLPRILFFRGMKICLRNPYLALGLAPAVMKKPKAEPRDTTDIPPSNPKDPIDLESSPEPLLKKKAGKRKQTDAEAEGQPAKKIQRKKITRRGNLDAFIAKPVLVVSPGAAGVDAGHPKSPEVVARGPEKGKSAQQIPVATSPSAAFDSAPEDIERNSGGNQGYFIQADENSPIHPDETPGDYYYRCYLEKQADEGTFPPGEIKFQEGHPHEQTYHAYLEEAASYTSTTHRIVREWRSMHKEWVFYEESKKKNSEDEARVTQLKATLEADRAKFDHDRKTEEWSVARWKRKAESEAALLSKERKNWREICEKDNAEKMGLRNVINNLRAEVEKLKKQDVEIEKLKQENAEAEAARDEARSHRERSKQREVAESVLNSEELDKTVAHLLVAARNDGYAQGYAKCSHHVVNALKVDWDTSKYATHGVDTEAALAVAKTQFNTSQLLVMDLINVVLHSEDFMTRLREIFPDR
ncbi:hypothetical protein Hdeb2414_s0017g00513561 [Helianthus debilis subsp. tardiflorus]